MDQNTDQDKREVALLLRITQTQSYYHCVLIHLFNQSLIVILVSYHKCSLPDVPVFIILLSVSIAFMSLLLGSRYLPEPPVLIWDSVPFVP